jgi:hypothetical protein
MDRPSSLSCFRLRTEEYNRTISYPANQSLFKRESSYINKGAFLGICINIPVFWTLVVFVKTLIMALRRTEKFMQNSQPTSASGGDEGYSENDDLWLIRPNRNNNAVADAKNQSELGESRKEGGSNGTIRENRTQEVSQSETQSAQSSSQQEGSKDTGLSQQQNHAGGSQVLSVRDTYAARNTEGIQVVDFAYNPPRRCLWAPPPDETPRLRKGSQWHTDKESNESKRKGGT